MQVRFIWSSRADEHGRVLFSDVYCCVEDWKSHKSEGRRVVSQLFPGCNDSDDILREQVVRRGW